MTIELERLILKLDAEGNAKNTIKALRNQLKAMRLDAREAAIERRRQARERQEQNRRASVAIRVQAREERVAARRKREFDRRAIRDTREKGREEKEWARLTAKAVRESERDKQAAIRKTNRDRKESLRIFDAAVSRHRRSRGAPGGGGGRPRIGGRGGGGFGASFGGNLAARGVEGVARAGADAFGGLVSNISDFEQIDSQLLRIEGSAEKASSALGLITDFAKEVKQPIVGVADAFIRLKALGLDASKEALLAFANVASGTRGKTTIDFVEAVADASVGEFERLKEFGVKGKRGGGRATFTFGDTVIETEDTTKAITEALKQIGLTDFAGAAAAKADTLIGSLTGIKNQALLLSKAIGQGGLLDAFKRVVKRLEEFTKNGADAEKLGASLARAVDALADAFFRLLPSLPAIVDGLTSMVTVSTELFEKIGGADGILTLLETFAAVKVASGFAALAGAIGKVNTAAGAALGGPLGVLLQGLIIAAPLLSKGLDAIVNNLTSFQGEFAGGQKRGAPKTLTQEFGSFGELVGKDKAEALRLTRLIAGETNKTARAGLTNTLVQVEQSLKRHEASGREEAGARDAEEARNQKIVDDAVKASGDAKAKRAARKLARGRGKTKKIDPLQGIGARGGRGAPPVAITVIRNIFDIDVSPKIDIKLADGGVLEAERLATQVATGASEKITKAIGEAIQSLRPATVQ